MRKRSEPINLRDATQFLEECESFGVSVPAILATAKAAIATAESLKSVTPVAAAIEMSAEQIEEFVLDRSVRAHRGAPHDGKGLEPGIDAFRELVQLEFADAVVLELDNIVEALQAQFEQAAAPLASAVTEYGFTLKTTADEVIAMENDDATAAWRNARRAWDAMYPLVVLRIRMIEVFHLRPSKDDQPVPRNMNREPNMSVLFAAGDNWSLDDQFRVEGSNSIDWFSLARGGLRLNTPSEVDAKLEAREAQWRHERAAAGAADAARAQEAAQAFLAQAERGMRAIR